MPSLIGAWSLVSCVNYRNDVGNPAFGEPPAGQIQYTSDGRMSAFLMDPAWVARGDAAARGVSDFFAYAGRWQLDGNRVTHDIELCSIPSRVGTRFVRTLQIVDEHHIELLTEPEISKSGAVYVSRLLWKRYRREFIADRPTAPAIPSARPPTQSRCVVRVGRGAPA